ncbi:hypothetical protein Hanom_Chr01g00070471 [Helianthus anomalus]
MRFEDLGGVKSTRNVILDLGSVRKLIHRRVAGGSTPLFITGSDEVMNEVVWWR